MSFCPGFMFSAGSAWRPPTPGNLVADFDAADTGTLTLSPGSSVAQWSDRSGNANHITQGTDAAKPTWESAGWNSTFPTVNFDGADDVLERTTGNIITDFDGSDSPFTVLMTVDFTSTADQSIIQWDDTGGGASGARSLVRTNFDGGSSSFLRYNRVDDAAGSATNTGTHNCQGRRRVAFIFTGTALSTFIDTVIDINAGANNVGTLTLSKFKLGNGATGFWGGSVAAFSIYSAALTATDVNNYQTYSLWRFGG